MSFKCHPHDQRYRDAVVAVCIRGRAFLEISTGKKGDAAYVHDVVHLCAGDVYDLTHDALTIMSQTICVDPNDRSPRRRLTLRHTRTQVALESEIISLLNPCLVRVPIRGTN